MWVQSSLRRLLTVLGAVTLLASSAEATVVNFDDLTGQGLVPDGYGGINWGGVWTHSGSFLPPYNAHSPEQSVGTPSPFTGEFTFTFVIPNSVFHGAWFAGQAFATVSFNLYDDGALVATSGSLSPSSAPTFLASGYTGAVDQVGVFSGANGFYVMDDVTYDSPSVPEPGTALLLGSGLILVGALRRRRAAK